jgi:hypothetical protein
MSRKSIFLKLSLKSVKSDQCEKAFEILKYSHTSCFSLHQAYCLVRSLRSIFKGNKDKKRKDGKESKTIKLIGGLSTDQEQDLLRSMLVSATSGLDAVLKQIIRDTLPIIIKMNHNARDEFEKYVSRKIKSEFIDSDPKNSSIFFAKILTSESIQKYLIEEYILSLSGNSLQSFEELSKVVIALSVTLNDCGIVRNQVDPIFKCRNKIIHEFDINLESHPRKRNIRTEKAMVNHVNTLFDMTQRILIAVDSKISIHT